MGKLAVILIVLLACPVATLVNEIKTVDFSEPIFINADGSITPSAAPIQQTGNVYTLTDDINITSGYGIVIQRSNTVLDGANHTISAMVHTELCYGIGISASNVTVKKMNERNFWIGIRVYSDFSTIARNVIDGNSFFGVWVQSSHNNICDNEILNNDYGGLGLSNASFNEISSNDISGTLGGIVVCESSSHNLMIENNISRIRFEAYPPTHIEDNSIYHNHILAPVDQPIWVKQDWDDDYPSGGNYWDYYSGLDLCSGVHQNETGSDGIGDTPYVIRVQLTVVDLEGKNSSTYTMIGVMMPTSISVSTTSLSCLLGFTVSINGKLQDFHGRGLSNKTVLVSYTFRGASTWFPVTSSITDDSGDYSAQWIPTATGYFTIKVEWAGNYTHFGATDTVALSILPYENQYVFAVESNSTISDLFFDSDSHKLSFAVDGENGTSGYTKVTIAKNLAPDIAKLKVHIDQTEYEYTIINMTDSWILLFAYNHSVHQIEIDLGQNPIPEFSSSLIIALFMIGTVLAVIARKKKHFWKSVSGKGHIILRKSYS